MNNQGTRPWAQPQGAEWLSPPARLCRFSAGRRACDVRRLKRPAAAPSTRPTMRPPNCLQVPGLCGRQDRGAVPPGNRIQHRRRRCVAGERQAGGDCHLSRAVDVGWRQPPAQALCSMQLLAWAHWQQCTTSPGRSACHKRSVALAASTSSSCLPSCPPIPCSLAAPGGCLPRLKCRPICCHPCLPAQTRTAAPGLLTTRRAAW